MLNCGPRWVTALCQQGRLAATKRGRSWLIDPSSVEDFQLRGVNAACSLRLAGKIEELTANLCRRGVSEEKALREAAFAVFQAAPDDQTQDWVAHVTGRRWPGPWGRSGSTSGGKGSSSGRISGTVRG